MHRLQEEKNQSSDEIDLRYVIDRIGAGFSNLFARIRYVMRVVLKRSLLMMLFLLLGAGISYGIYYVTKPYFTSSMTLMLANIRNEFIEDQLNKLSLMVAEENFEAVADRLDISPAAAQRIKEMSFSNLDADRVEEDSVLTGSPFRIQLSLYDRELFESMEPALTNYLENNRYFAKQKRIKQRQVENMVSKLKGEISSIDSMKTNVSEPKGPVNGFIYGQPIDPTNLYRESILMYKEQVKLEADLEKLDNVEIVTGFVPRLRPTGPSLIKYLAIGAIISFIIGTIIALNLESKKRRKSL
ncbi:chain length determinant protein [Pontibacter sp. HJ8]